MSFTNQKIEIDKNLSENEQSKAKESRSDKFVSGVFLASVAGLSMLGGFGMTLAMAKRRDPSFFVKGLLPTKELPESGSDLALRALGWGTLYAVSGFSLFCCGVWSLLGVKNLQEFRMKMGGMLPAIPKHENQGRSDFKSLRDLLNYIIEESDKNKKR